MDQQQQFWQFSDKLRGSNNNSLVNNDSIWSTSYVSKRGNLNNNNNPDFTTSTSNKFLPDEFSHQTDYNNSHHHHQQQQQQRIADFNHGFNSAIVNLKSTDFNTTKQNPAGGMDVDYFSSRFNSALDLNQKNDVINWTSSDNHKFSNGGFNKGIYSNNNTNSPVGGGAGFKNYVKNNNKQVE